LPRMLTRAGGSRLAARARDHGATRSSWWRTAAAAAPSRSGCRPATL